MLGVVFRGGGALWFLPPTVAQRVVAAPPIGRIPGAPPAVAGLALVEGEVIPVVALGEARSAMLVVSYLDDRLGLVGVEVLATGRFEQVPGDGAHGESVAWQGELARSFDVAAVVAQVRGTRWAV